MKIKTPLKNTRVLVVDDIPKWRKVARDNLNFYGCVKDSIITAEDTEEAFKKYQNQHPTLIITDINFDTENLDNTQGLDLIQRLRRNGYLKPIVAMSSSGRDIDSKTKNAGADYFIDKKNFVQEFDGFVEWYGKHRK